VATATTTVPLDDDETPLSPSSFVPMTKPEAPPYDEENSLFAANAAVAFRCHFLLLVDACDFSCC